MSLIQTDLLGIAQTNVYFDEHTGECHVERVQDAEPLLDKVKALRGAGWDGYNDDRSMRAVGEFPVTIFEQMMKEGIDVFSPSSNAEVMRRLNDPALAGFRTDQRFGPGSSIIVKGAR